MQVIAAVAGARVYPSGQPVHGKAHAIVHQEQGILAGIPNPFLAARYHSLHVHPATVPAALEITARTVDGIIMGCRLKGTATEGVLFHPESFLTEYGPALLRNFLHVV
jgi:anthranilate/para-aminobenzoate synthase component II